MMMTARGKIQRVAVREISVIGRNTQGVRIMGLGDDDKLAAVVRRLRRTSVYSLGLMYLETKLNIAMLLT